jgi:uncharacterized alkaline shock family protein YloU
VKKATVLLRENAHGRVTMTTGAIAAVAGRAVEESFGVVDQATGRRGPLRLLARSKGDPGVRIREADGGLALELHVVVDHGVNLAEVTAMVQSRVAYEVERHTGLDVKAVDVHVDSARRTG